MMKILKSMVKGANLKMNKLACPYCTSTNLIKKGFKKSKQRYKCNACGRKTVQPIGIIQETVKAESRKLADGFSVEYDLESFDLESIFVSKKTAETVKRYEEMKMEIPNPDLYNPRLIVESEKQNAKLRQDLNIANVKLKYLDKELTSEKIKNQVFDILDKNKFPRIPVKIEPFFGNDTNEAAAVICLSDLHLEEDVNPITVNHLNEYNPQIAEVRFKKVFYNALKLIKQQEKDIKITKIILWLGGDIISGFIHPELMESNHLSPNKAILFADELITWGIDFLSNNTKCEIVVPTSHGNHGRSTEYMRIQTAADNSWEYLLYKNLERRYAKDKRVRFQVAEGYLNYLDVFNFKVRFHHGDSLRYAGGVGGLFIPANKAISEWDRAIKADLDVFGHFHQLIFSTKFVCNGSLIGYNAYALSIKASPEDAQQAFFLIDKNRNKVTMRAPIFVD